MQEDEEAGVAESWQEIIFRVHQPPPAQSAEKKHSSRLSTEDGGRRRESGRARGRERRAQANRHMFTYLRLGVKLSRSSFDSRWYKHGVSCVEGHIYLQQGQQSSLEMPSLLTRSTSTARKRKHASIARKYKHSIQERVQHCPQ
jgi:hypothetical protein